MAFPRMTGGYHVAKAAADTGAKWSEEWIAAVERQNGIEPRSVPVPERGQWVLSSDEFEKWPEDQTPVILVMVPGLLGIPRHEADRSLTAPVALTLGILVGTGHSNDANRELAELYASAFGSLFLRHPIEGLATAGIDYVDERWTDVPGRSERTLGAARVIFRLWVKNWRELRGGPPSRTVPRDNPYVADAPPNLVETIYPNVSKKED